MSIYRAAHSELRVARIVRHRDIDLYIIRRAPPLELRLNLHHVFHPAALVAFHSCLDPYEWLYGGRETVGHELELAVRRDEGNCTVVLEAREAHALMELDVFHLDRLPPRGPPCALKHHLVVQTKTQLGHSGEVALHLDGPQDF